MSIVETNEYHLTGHAVFRILGYPVEVQSLPYTQAKPFDIQAKGCQGMIVRLVTSVAARGCYAYDVGRVQGDATYTTRRGEPDIIMIRATARRL